MENVIGLPGEGVIVSASTVDWPMKLTDSILMPKGGLCGSELSDRDLLGLINEVK